jgi:hypothetical protein
MCGVVFRFRGSDFGGKYGFVSVSEEEREPQPDLESLDLRTRNLTPGGRIWHPGMWLPMRPTDLGTHYGNVRARGRQDSIDYNIIEDLSLDEDLASSC